jgi:hypothetical protein
MLDDLDLGGEFSELLLEVDKAVTQRVAARRAARCATGRWQLGTRLGAIRLS